MITREWIIAILWDLPVWHWPVFFLELARFRRWWATGPAEAGTMVVLAVTLDGHIVIDAIYAPTGADPTDWTRHAPRAPWDWLTLALTTGFGRPAHDTALIPSRYHSDTVVIPPEHPGDTATTLLQHLAPP